MKAVAACIALTVLCGTGAFAQVDERVIYASVVDNKGAPVLNITPKDLVIREDGQAREILRIAKDEDPLQVALLVDNSATMRDRLSELRKAVTAFVAGLRPGVEVALLTLAERPTILVNYTTDHTALLQGVDRMVTYEAGDYVIDGIAEVSEGMKKRSPTRSMMVVLTGVGPELSYRHYSDAIRPLRESGAVLHAIVVTAHVFDTAADATRQGAIPQENAETAAAGADRDIVLGRMTKETGGRFEEVVAMSSLAAKLEQLAAEISNQYRVTFARPQRLIPPKNTEISAKQSSLHARGMLAK